MRVVADDVFAQKICIVDGQRNYMYLEGVSRKVLLGVAYGYEDSDDVPMMLNDGRRMYEPRVIVPIKVIVPVFREHTEITRRFRLSYHCPSSK